MDLILDAIRQSWGVDIKAKLSCASVFSETYDISIEHDLDRDEVDNIRRAILKTLDSAISDAKKIISAKAESSKSGKAAQRELTILCKIKEEVKERLV